MSLGEVPPSAYALLGTMQNQPERIVREGIPIASFPADLHSELIRLDIDHNGILDVKEIEVAMRVLVNERKGKVSVKAFDPRLEQELKDLGADEDGYLGFRQIEEALLSLLENRKRVRQMKWALTLLLVVGAVFLAAVFGLVYAVVDLTKDMRSLNGVLVDRVTGQALQTASSLYTVDSNGVLMPKTTAPTTRSKSRRSQEERRDEGIVSFAPGDGTAVKTSVLTLQYQLDSRWTPGQLESLNSLMTNKYGGFMAANIDGLVVIYEEPNPIVVFQTGLGRLVLNATTLAPAEGAYATANLLQLYDSLPHDPPSNVRGLKQALQYCSGQYWGPGGTTNCCACGAGYPTACVYPNTNAVPAPFRGQTCSCVATSCGGGF